MSTNYYYYYSDVDSFLGFKFSEVQRVTRRSRMSGPPVKRIAPSLYRPVSCLHNMYDIGRQYFEKQKCPSDGLYRSDNAFYP